MQIDEGAMATDTAIRGPAHGIAISADGTIYFSDASRIRRIGLDGRVTTVFGELTPSFSEDGVRSGRLSMVERMETTLFATAGCSARAPSRRWRLIGAVTSICGTSTIGAYERFAVLRDSL